MKNILQKYNVSSSNAMFAMRTTTASIIALFIVLEMNIDSPKWAPMTVWIVAQQTRGMSLSKGHYRIAGTFIGAMVGVALISAFAQTPEIFALALATWVGVCTSLSTTAFHFRSYGAVLAGYTAAIISLDAVAAPENIFNIAIARGSDIMLGVIVEGIIAAIFSREASTNEMLDQISEFGRQSFKIGASLIRGNRKNTEAIHKQFSTALSLDGILAFTAIESSEVRQYSKNCRDYIFSSLTILAYACTIDTRDTSPFRKTVLARWLSAVKIWREHQKNISRRSTASTSRHPGFILHVDRSAILVNGLRAFIAMLIGMNIWINFSGSLGVGFVTIIAVICSLFATRSNAVAGSLSFLKGAAVATVASAIYNFWLLPLSCEFGMLALFLFGFLFIAGLLMRHPVVAGSAASFAIFFWDLTNPQNAERMTPDQFFNGALTLLLGMACASLIFSLLFPSSPNAVRRQLHSAARRDLRSLGSHPQKITRDIWLSQCVGRLGHESALDQNYNDGSAETFFDGMIANWLIGDAAIELRDVTAIYPSFNNASIAVFDALTTGDPLILADTCKLSQTLLLEETSDLSVKEKELRQDFTRALETIFLAATTHKTFLDSSLRQRPKFFLT